MSILTNVSILTNQITLIIKWMSIRANVSILSNPLSRIIKSKVFNLKMDEHSSESFTRIYISSWMSIHESNDFNYKMDEH